MFKNLSWSLITTISNILFQFLGVVILSKLITPAEYGIVGIMVFFTNIADVLVDSGMGGALIYKKNVTDVDFSTLFLYNFIVSVFLYIILFILATPISVFYQIPNLVSYIRVYGLIIIIIALCITQDCKLRKKMDFKTLALISIVSNLISLGVAIYGGYHGWGIWALITQALLFQIVRTFALYIVCGFNKHYHFSFNSFVEQFHFGGWLLLSNVIQSVCSNIYANIIPKIGTLSQNGCYTQSVKIGYVPTNTINLTVGAVAFPYLVQSNNEKDLTNKARHLNRKLFHVSFPMLALLSIISFEIIMVILGEQWIEADYYLKIILLSGIGEVISFMYRTYLKSQGKTRLITRLEIIKSVIKLSLIGLSLLGGIRLLIHSILLSSVANALLSLIIINNHTSYNFRDSLRDLAVPFCLTCCVYLFSWGITLLLGEHSYLNIAVAVLSYLSYFGIGLILKNQDVKELVTYVISKVTDCHAKK